MNRRITITRIAEKDLREIWVYTAVRVTTEVADKLIATIRAEMDKLAAMPGMGHRRTDIPNPQFRVWPVYSYPIIYRVTTVRISISRVVSGHRNIGAMFRRKK